MSTQAICENCEFSVWGDGRLFCAVTGITKILPAVERDDNCELFERYAGAETDTAGALE